MGLRFVHVFGDEHGETHFSDVELPAPPAPGSESVSFLQLPIERMGYAEYPAERDEIMPGFHETPGRHFIVPLRGGFQTWVTDGSTRTFTLGDVVFFDDLESKGHLTKQLPGEPRINLVLNVPDDWGPSSA
jgi:hypothetical protein